MALAAALVLAPLAALADPVADGVVAEARALCEGFENGSFSTTAGTVTRIDVTGDGEPESLIDESTYGCSSAASMYCGTGGCGLVAVVEGKAFRFLVKGWRVVEWGPDRVLLIAIHGYECGGTNLRRCYEALVWSEGRFATVNAGRVF